MNYVNVTELQLAKAIIVQRPSKIEELQIGDHDFKNLLIESVRRAVEGNHNFYNKLIGFLNEAIADNREIYDYLDYYLQDYPINLFGILNIGEKLYKSQRNAFFCDVAVKVDDYASSNEKKEEHLQENALLRIAIGLGIISKEDDLPLKYINDEGLKEALKKANEIEKIRTNPTYRNEFLSIFTEDDGLFLDSDDENKVINTKKLPDAELVLYALREHISYVIHNAVSKHKEIDGTNVLDEWMEQIVFFYPNNKKIAATIIRWAFPSIQYLSEALKNNLELLKVIAEEGYNNACGDYANDLIFDYVNESTDEFLRNNQEFAKLVFLSKIFNCQMQEYSETIKFDEETINKRLIDLSDYPSFTEFPNEFQHILKHTPRDLLYRKEFKEIFYKVFNEDIELVDEGFNYYFANTDNNFDDEYGNSALMLALRYNNLKLFKDLLEKTAIDSCQQNQYGDTVLHDILNSKNELAFSIFLDHIEINQDLFTITNQSGTTPLHLLSEDQVFQNILDTYLKKRPLLEQEETTSKRLKF
jgi:hypothetical protein